MSEKTISTALFEVIKKSDLIDKRIGDSISEFEFTSSSKNNIVVAFMSIILQHHNSIVLLTNENLQSSASALARPLVDALYRGTWVTLVADEEMAQKISKGTECFAKTEKLAKQIDSTINSTTFSEIWKRNSTTLHGMTHGGVEQLARQFNDDASKVEPSFTDKEMIELLNSSTVNLAMMLLALSYNFKDEKLEALAKEIITA